MTIQEVAKFLRISTRTAKPPWVHRSHPTGMIRGRGFTHVKTAVHEPLLSADLNHYGEFSVAGPLRSSGGGDFLFCVSRATLIGCACSAGTIPEP